MRTQLKTGFWFIVVGTAAALTHMLVFALTHDLMWPEFANALGFGVAFLVSFSGHRRLSFADSHTPLWQSLRRFAVTAVGGFMTNEMLFVLLYRGFDWPSWLALFVALVAASGQTFVLSRFWAFRRGKEAIDPPHA